MYSPAQLRPPHARRRHRLTALTATAALSLAGLLAAASPAMAGTAPTVIATIQVGGVLSSVAVAPDSARAYVTNDGDNTVSVISTAINAVAATIAVGTGPLAVAVTPDGTRAYVANSDGTVSVIDTATNTVTGTIAVGLSPSGVAISPDGTTAYVTNKGGGSVSVISTANDTVTATIGVGRGPAAVAVSPDGTRVYTANMKDNSVSIISTASDTVTTPGVVGNGPVAVAFSPGGQSAYVANEGGSVSVISTATGTVVANFAAGSDPAGIAVKPDGTRLYTANTADDAISVIDTATDTLSATVPVGHGPVGIAFSPDGTRAYAANLDGTLNVLDIAPPPAPAVTAVRPVTGTTAGGTTVTITGTALAGATAITFGTGHRATRVSCTATSCTARSPAEAAGTVSVRVTTAGGTSPASRASRYTYVRPFTFTGFLRPVRNPPFVNPRIAGHVIAMRFRLGGRKGLNVIAAGYPTTRQISCTTGRPTGAPAPAATDGFTYHPRTGRYSYLWQTSRRFRGTCRQFTLKLTDGSTHTARFAFGL